MLLNAYPEKLLTKTIKQIFSSNSKSKNSQNLETPKPFLLYEKKKKKKSQNNLNALLINMVSR